MWNAVAGNEIVSYKKRPMHFMYASNWLWTACAKIFIIARMIEMDLQLLGSLVSLAVWVGVTQAV